MLGLDFCNGQSCAGEGMHHLEVAVLSTDGRLTQSTWLMGRGLAGPVVATRLSLNVPVRAKQTAAHASNLDVVSVPRQSWQARSCGAPWLSAAGKSVLELRCGKE